MWLVKTVYPWHSCTPNGRCKLLKGSMIERLYFDKLRLKPKFMPLDIQEDIKDKWKFASSRSQCQNGRLIALRMLEKEYSEQFAHIHGYAEEIWLSNPCSKVLVDTIPYAKGEDIFQRFYVCFEKTRECWSGSCRPVIGLDGTFQKVATKGCLLSAIGHVANNQIYPLAWAAVQSENGSNWLWFMKLIKEHLNLKDGSSFVFRSLLTYDFTIVQDGAIASQEVVSLTQPTQEAD